MEGIENQNVTNYRDQLVDKMKSKYPDRNFEGIEGQEAPADLEQSIIDAFNDYDSQISGFQEKQKVYDENTQRLTDLFNNSPRAAIFLNTLATSGDPSAAIYKAYGRDAYEAFKEGSASDLIASIEAEDAKNRADNEQFEQEKADNLKASLEALDAWGNEKGLDEQGKVDVFMKFYNILSDALIGKYSTDLFEMAWKADHYTEDVDNARREGEVTGRNANIKAQARRRQDAASMPPALAGQGESVPENRPRKAQNWSDFLK